MQNDGYIAIYRKILNNPIVCKDSDYLAIWIYLLLNATYKEQKVLFKGEPIILKKGQLITGRKIISQKLCIDENKVQRILKSFENAHQIKQQTSNKNRLITIVNWEMYQKDEQQNKQQLNNKRTTTEQQLNTNNKDNKVNNNINIYNTTTILEFVEENFGRTLSPIEYEEILNWQDNELTRYAIRQAVLNGKYNIKYINSILNSYKKNNIKTVQDAQKQEEEFLKRKQNKQEAIPNWFNKNVDDDLLTGEELETFEKELRGEK